MDGTKPSPQSHRLERKGEDDYFNRVGREIVMADELKPCPFCGGLAVYGETAIQNWVNAYHVGDCPIPTIGKDGMSCTPSAWNTRTLPEDVGKNEDLEGRAENERT